MRVGAHDEKGRVPLDLHAETPDPVRPVVCFDESPAQLIGEVRQLIPPAPGQPGRCDCEYRRNGMANLFIFLGAYRPWRHMKVTDRRTAQDFAMCMRDLADTHHPEAECLDRRIGGRGRLVAETATWQR